MGRTTCLLQRPYSDTPPYELSYALQSALELDLQSMSLKVEVPLYQGRRVPLVVATDGRLDDSGPPTIATSVFDPENGLKVALVATILEQLTN